MADRSEQLRARLIATFRIEARDHLKSISSNLDAVLLAPDSPDVVGHVESLFRNVHTLKGAARSVGLTAIESMCQGCESTLRSLTLSKAKPGTEVLNSLREATDRIGALIEREMEAKTTPAAADRPAVPVQGRPAAPRAEAKSSPQATAVPPRGTASAQRPAATESAVVPQAPRRPPPARESRETTTSKPVAISDTIRVEVDRIDKLVTQAENLLTPKLSLGRRIEDLKVLVRGIDALRQRVANLTVQRQVRGAHADTPIIDDLRLGIEDVRQQGMALLRGLDDDHGVIRKSVDELFSELRNVRMMPAATILEAFPMMIRDLADNLNKNVEWQTTGEGLEVDRKVLEFIKDPLIHMVRNAVDHGIEEPAVRVQAKKPRQGKVVVGFSRPDSGRIAIRIEDDGKGIDAARVKQAAVRMRLIDQQRAETTSDEEVYDLIFRSGLSTSPVISTVSGHGLGLSVVRERIERLGGVISIESELGKGTAITFVIPESIATFHGLLVYVAGQSFLLPGDAVERAIRLDPDDIQSASRQRLVRWNDAAIPFAYLADVLGMPRLGGSRMGEAVPCVVVRHGGQLGAFAVDEIDGEREVLVKEFQWPIMRARNIAAIGLLGTGDQTFILRQTDLLRSMHHAVPLEADLEGAKAARLRRLRVLVVDDSLTTRTMERHLFESSGFIVKIAADGLDAWNVLGTEDIDLVVSDIDMPRMDGFELTSRIRADPRLLHLPIILVTALESREDKERGLRLGANAYVQKSTFDQSGLLEIVRRLI